MIAQGKVDAVVQMQLRFFFLDLVYKLLHKIQIFFRDRQQILLDLNAVLMVLRIKDLLDQRFIDAGSAQFRGIVGQQRVKPTIVKAYLIPIAPFEEQKRIVAAVGAVFSILDDIDSLQGLYSENMQSIRNKIIEAGIRGKLTEQLPEDGTAVNLLEHIAEKRAALQAAKVIRKTKPLPPVSENEEPFRIPSSCPLAVFISEVTSFLSAFIYSCHLIACLCKLLLQCPQGDSFVVHDQYLFHDSSLSSLSASGVPHRAA